MQAMDFRALQAKNRRGTWLLLASSFALLALVAAIVGLLVLGGWVAAVIGVLIAGLTTFFSYRRSSEIALRATRAQPADPQQFLQLHNVVEEMALAAGMPKPAVYVVDDPAPNAFATGRDPEHAAIAATTGLLAKLNREELQGVIGHEMAHIRNLDIRVMTVAVATAGAIAIIADLFWRFLFFGGGSRRGNSKDNGAAAALMLVGFLFVAVLAPLAAGLLRAAISRSREGLADATAVELTRNPSGLRKALEKLDADVTVIRRTSHATSHLWIESPDDRERQHKGRRFNDMYNTHPPLTERIDSLRRMEGLAPYEGPDPAVVEQLRAADPVVAGIAAGPPASWADAAHLAPAAPAAPVAVAELPPAGWYADPAGGPQLRWWNGHGWTSFTAG